MKITKAELRKIIEEELTKEAINPGGLTRSEIQAKVDREKANYRAAKAAGNEEAASRASREMGVYIDDLEGALPDPEEDSVDDQTKKMVTVDKNDVDEINDLATKLEKELDGELKKKATDIINIINTRLYG